MSRLNFKIRPSLSCELIHSPFLRIFGSVIIFNFNYNFLLCLDLLPPKSQLLPLHL